MADEQRHEPRDLLAEVALGIADGAERARVLEHVSGCADCRLELERQSAIADGLLLLAPEQEPPPGFELGVLRAIEPPAPSPRSLRSLFRRSLPALAAATAAAAIAVGGLLFAFGDDRRAGRRVPRRARRGERQLLRCGPARRRGGTPRWRAVPLPRRPVVDPRHGRPPLPRRDRAGGAHRPRRPQDPAALVPARRRRLGRRPARPARGRGGRTPPRRGRPARARRPVLLTVGAIPSRRIAGRHEHEDQEDIRIAPRARGCGHPRPQRLRRRRRLERGRLDVERRPDGLLRDGRRRRPGPRRLPGRGPVRGLPGGGRQGALHRLLHQHLGAPHGERHSPPRATASAASSAS